MFNEFLKFCLFSPKLWGAKKIANSLEGAKKIERHFSPNFDYLSHIDIVNVRYTVIRVPV